MTTMIVTEYFFRVKKNIITSLKRYKIASQQTIMIAILMYLLVLVFQYIFNEMEK